MTPLAIARLVALVGTIEHTMALPTVRQAMLECPPERGARAMAWLAWTTRYHGYSRERTIQGIHSIAHGWDDFYTIPSVTRGARKAPLTEPITRSARVIRPATGGRWARSADPRVGVVRPEIDLAATWLAELAGCLVHDDCLMSLELARACASSR